MFFLINQLLVVLIIRLLDTIEDCRSQIRRTWLGDLTILSNFHIKTSSLWSVSDYEFHFQVFRWFVTSFDNWSPFWYLFFITFTIMSANILLCFRKKFSKKYSLNHLGLLTTECVSINQKKTEFAEYCRTVKTKKSSFVNLWNFLFTS